MMLDDVTQIIKPEPDSQFRLRPCPRCLGDNVAYAQKKGSGGELWHGMCFDCGYTGEGDEIRHNAQLLWNFNKEERKWKMRN